MPERLRITGCRLITPFQDLPEGELLLEEDRIVFAGARDGGSSGRSPHEAVLEAGGRLAVPGLIDLHLQGAGGSDVLDGTPEAMRTIARSCARHGVTGFLATTVFRPGGDNRHLPVAAAACRPSGGGPPGGRPRAARRRERTCWACTWKARSSRRRSGA